MNYGIVEDCKKSLYKLLKSKDPNLNFVTQEEWLCVMMEMIADNRIHPEHRTHFKRCPKCGGVKSSTRERSLKTNRGCRCVNRSNAQKPRKPKRVFFKEYGERVNGEVFIHRIYRQVPR